MTHASIRSWIPWHLYMHRPYGWIAIAILGLLATPTPAVRAASAPAGWRVIVGATTPSFANATDVAIGSRGDLYVADAWFHEIQQLSPAGVVLHRWAMPSYPHAAPLDTTPTGVALDSKRNIFALDSGGNNMLIKLTPSGKPSPDWTPVQLSQGYPPVVANAGWMPKRGPLWFSQTGVAVDAYGDVFAIDSDSDRQGNRAVWEYTPTGRLLHFWGDRGDRTGHFYSPQSVAIGPTGSIYVADTGNNRIQMLPRQASPARTSSGAIVLGSTSFHAGIGKGWGTVKPGRIFNGGDPSGIVEGIRWQHWGQTTDIGRCSARGPLAYRRLDIRAPGRPGGPLGPWSNWSFTGNICHS